MNVITTLGVYALCSVLMLMSIPSFTTNALFMCIVVLCQPVLLYAVGLLLIWSLMIVIHGK